MRLWATVFAVAVALRLLAALPVLLDPTQALDVGDSPTYHKMAVNLLEHGTWELTLHRTPGFPIALSAFYLVVGTSPAAGVLFNVLIDSLTALAVILLAGSLGFSRSLSLLAGGLYAIAVGPVLWAGTVMTEPLFGLWLVLAIWGVVQFEKKNSWKWILLTGLMLGGATWTRAIGLYLPLLFVFVLFLRARRIQGPVLLMAGHIGVVLPLVLFNGMRHDVWNVGTTSRNALIYYEGPAIHYVQEPGGFGDLFTEFSFPRRSREHHATWLAKKTGNTSLQWNSKLTVEEEELSREHAWEGIRSYPVSLFGIHLAGMVRCFMPVQMVALLDRRGSGVSNGIAILLGILFLPVVGLFFRSAFLFFRHRRGGPGITEALMTILYLMVLPGPMAEHRFLVPAIGLLILVALHPWKPPLDQNQTRG